MAKEPVKLRQSVNNVIVEGYLSSKEFKTGVTKNPTNPKNYISGKIQVRQDENNFVELEMFSTETNSKGEESKVYKSLMTVMAEYKDATMVEGVNPEQAYLQADKIRITGGQINANEFVKEVNGENEVLTAIKYATSFVNRVTDDSFDPKAKWKLEVFINKITPETDKDDDETGRGFVDGYFVGYDGLPKPVRLVAEGKTWTQIEAKLESGETVTFWGDIVNSVSTIKQVIEADFGEDEERIITNTKKERVIRGAKINEENAYEAKEMKAGLKSLGEHYAQLKEDAMIQGSSNKGGNDLADDNDDDGDDKLPWEKK